MQAFSSNIHYQLHNELLIWHSDKSESKTQVTKKNKTKKHAKYTHSLVLNKIKKFVIFKMSFVKNK